MSWGASASLETPVVAGAAPPSPYRPDFFIVRLRRIPFRMTENDMKFSTLAAAAALAIAGVSSAAFATDVAVGAKIYGPDGAEVGTVEKVEGGNVVVNTGSLKATLPTDVFGDGEKGATIGWNKAQLEAAVTEANQQAAAQLEAALVAGAEVYSVDGQLLGTVEKIDGGIVVVAREAGPLSLPQDQIAMQGEKVTFLATAADIEAAVAAQGGD